VTTYNQYHKLRHVKGPWLASISPVWLFYYTCKGTLYLAVENALKKYGMRVWTHQHRRIPICWDQVRRCVSVLTTSSATIHGSKTHEHAKIALH